MATQNQDRLRAHFADHDPSTHPSRWDSLWKDGSFIPWDRGFSNPALIDLLTISPPPISTAHNASLGAPKTASIENISLPKPLRNDGTQARVLVPGCGKGYDVALFAASGYDVFGLEVSESAVETARKYLEDPGEGPLEGEYKVKDEKVGKGKTTVVLGDYFKDEWVDGISGGEKGFDIIYDITVCSFSLAVRDAKQGGVMYRWTNLWL